MNGERWLPACARCLPRPLLLPPNPALTLPCPRLARSLTATRCAGAACASGAPRTTPPAAPSWSRSWTSAPPAPTATSTSPPRCAAPGPSDGLRAAAGAAVGERRPLADRSCLRPCLLPCAGPGCSPSLTAHLLGPAFCRPCVRRWRPSPATPGTAKASAGSGPTATAATRAATTPAATTLPLTTLLTTLPMVTLLTPLLTTPATTPAVRRRRQHAQGGAGTGRAVAPEHRAQSCTAVLLLTPTLPNPHAAQLQTTLAPLTPPLATPRPLMAPTAARRAARMPPPLPPTTLPPAQPTRAPSVSARPCCAGTALERGSGVQLVHVRPCAGTPPAGITRRSPRPLPSPSATLLQPSPRAPS